MKPYNVPVCFDGAVVFYDDQCKELSNEVLGNVAIAGVKATTDNPDAPVDMISITEDKVSDGQLDRVFTSATVCGLWEQTGQIEQKNQACQVPVAFNGTVTLDVPDDLSQKQQQKLAEEAAVTQVLGTVDPNTSFQNTFDKNPDGVIIGAIVESAGVEGRWSEHDDHPVKERRGKTM